MKVLAILDLTPGLQIDTVRSELAKEIKGSWALYASGVLREAYATAVPTRVVFSYSRLVAPRPRRNTFVDFHSLRRDSSASNW